jgi:hypothetical protein
LKNSLKILVALFLTLFVSANSIAQKEINGTDKLKPQKYVFGVKGMVLPYLLGNGSGIANNLGFESIFLNHHSFGINGMYHISGGSFENVTDTLGIKHKTGKNYKSIEKALNINYRYYFNFYKFSEARGKAFYSSLIYRYGKTNRFEDPAYKVDYLTQFETKNTIAFAIGMLARFKTTDRFGIDINMGVSHKNINLVTNYRDNNIIKTKFENSSNFCFWVGLTVGYYLLNE